MSRKPTNMALYNRVKNEAKRKFKVWPSAYGSAYLVKTYKQRGGTYSTKKTKSSGIGRWFDEKWIDVCHLPKVVRCGRRKSNIKNYPYCRPSVRVNQKTPVVATKLSKKEISRLCRRKQKYPRRKMKSLRRSVARCVKLRRSTRSDKKFMVKMQGCRIIHFGAFGYSDFSIHKDEARKKRYIARHKKRENWTKSGLCSAGFWAKHLLWNKPTIESSKRDISRRFGVKFC